MYKSDDIIVALCLGKPQASIAKWIKTSSPKKKKKNFCDIECNCKSNWKLLLYFYLKLIRRVYYSTKKFGIKSSNMMKKRLAKINAFSVFKIRGIFFCLEISLVLHGL